LIHQGDRTMDVFADIVKTTPYLEIGAIAFKLGNKDDSYEQGAERWYELLARITHTLELLGQHYNQCDKATNKDQAREREEREREK